MFRKGTMTRALHEEDFSDLTPAEIAEVFDVDIQSIYNAMSVIFEKTGHRVRYARKLNGGTRVVIGYGIKVRKQK